MKSRKGRKCCKLLPIVVLLLIMVPAAAPAFSVRGTVDSNSRWTIGDSPVHITSDLLVAQGVTLTIDPGVTVIFNSRPDTSRGYNLTIEGTLSALGSAAEPIVFTAQDRNSPWGAIIFSDVSRDWNAGASAGSILSYCAVEYGGNYPDGGAMIVTDDALPRIENNTIRFSSSTGVGIYATTGGEVSIIDNRIHSNPVGVRLHGEGGIVSGNYFLNNARALDITSTFNALDISSNTIKTSSSELFGSGLLLQLEDGAGGIRSYLWEQTGGPEVTIDNPNSALATFTAPDPGDNIATLTLDLTVTGGRGDQDTKSVEVMVIGTNEPPMATAGDDQNVNIANISTSNVRVTLTGAGSHDPDLGIAGYQWHQESGKLVNLQDSDSMAATFNVPSSTTAGEEMTFVLTVTDNGGLQSTDKVTVRYYNNNIFPLADAGNDITAFQGQLVILDGSGSSDPEGGISSYWWIQTGGPPVSLYNFNTGQPFFTAPEVEAGREALTFALYVRDTSGLLDVDRVTVNVIGNVLAYPGENSSVSAGQRVNLNAGGSYDFNAVSDNNIEANRIESDNDGAGLIAVTASEDADYQLVVTGNNLFFTEEAGYGVFLFDWAGNASDTLDMMDNWWGTDDAVLIDEMIHDQKDDLELPTVNYDQFTGQAIENSGSALNYPAIANAGPDITTSVDEGVALDGSNSYDPDEIGEYLWEQVDGPAVTLKNTQSQTANFVAPAGGTEGEELRFNLTMTTDGIFTHTDEVIVTITPDESLPLVEVGGEGGCFIGSLASLSDNTNRAITMMIFPAILILAGVLLIRRSKSIAAVCILTLSVLFASNASAGFFAVGGGDGGDAEQYNVTIEAGAKDIAAGPTDLLFSIGIPLLPHGDNNIPENTIATSCPNDACIPLGIFAKGTEVGFYAKLGIELGSSNIYLNAIGGGTAVTESELASSPTTGNTYEQSSDTTIEPLYGGGLSFFPESFGWQLLIQVDYDTRRGVTGTVGWFW